jgi:hypothetical protein
MAVNYFSQQVHQFIGSQAVFISITSLLVGSGKPHA